MFRLFSRILQSRQEEKSYFDAQYYLNAYPDVKNAGMDPFIHFVNHGWREGRNPSSSFHTLFYKDRNLGGRLSENPLTHYSQHKDDGELRKFPESEQELVEVQRRVIEPEFDPSYYSKRYSVPIDTALEHYLTVGWRKGFEPNRAFSTSEYLRAHPHIAAANVSPFYHFVTTRDKGAASAEAAESRTAPSSTQLGRAYEGRLEELVVGNELSAVTGWALDRKTGTFPSRFDIYYDRKRIDCRLVRSSRDDLVKARKGDGNCAFTAYVRLPDIDPGKLVVSLDGGGAELRADAQLRTKPDSARGRLEGVNAKGVLFGWLADQNVKDKRPALLKQGDLELMRVEPDLPRPDLKFLYYDSNRVGFEIGLEKLVAALAAQDPQLGFFAAPPTIGLVYGAEVVSTLPLSSCGALDGEIESVSDSVRGWAVWRWLPDRPVELEIEVNGRPLGRFVAAEPRADARGGKAFAFSAPLPSDLVGAADLVVSVTAGPHKAALPLSPAMAAGAPKPTEARPAETRKLPMVFRRRAERAKIAEKMAEKSSSPVARREHQPGRKNAVVVSWDMGHNPAGRAYLLADMLASRYNVELVGPLFARYGGKLWGPIANSPMTMRTFEAERLRDLVEQAKQIAGSKNYDVVYVSKPRLPSLLLGALIKLASGCRMVVDVDDHELSFFPNHDPIDFESFCAQALENEEAIDTPHSELWTRLCETLIDNADAVTVSNVALQRKFGGEMVRHGRDETLFDPALYDRAATRAAFGFGPKDRIILFLGTPRAHKGIFTIADALESIDAPDVKLCVIGTITDRRLSARLKAYKKARISLHPDQPWSDLPKLVAMADLVPILQDPESPVAEFQIPAKLTDALAMGVPVIATPVPPLEDLIATGAIRAVATDEDLIAVLKEFSEAPPEPKQSEASRSLYLSEFTYALNSSRIQAAIDAAAEARPDTRRFDEALDFIERRTGVGLQRFDEAARRTIRITRFTQEKRPRDLVFLWKQNDSGIYGRRSDMMLKYLRESGHIRNILHLDAPMSGSDLHKQIQKNGHAVADQGNLVAMNTIQRFLTLDKSQRAFIYRSDDVREVLGVKLPEKSDYPAFISAAMAEAGIGFDPILWVCPVVFDLATIIDVVNPGLIIADIIDDQRTSSRHERYVARLQAAYREALSRADLVYCNCTPVQEGFAELRSDIRVVPNGAEAFEASESWPMPAALRALPRPIIGYVGNLRDRVDIDLIKKVADAHPDKSVVLIGSAHNFPKARLLDECPNVHFLGVRPYDEAVRFIRHFDVAMMPHVANEVSNNMNPLKLYLYFCLHVPIITTAVANIEEIAPYSIVADGHADFLEKLDVALAGGGPKVDAERRSEIIESVSWRSRLEPILRDMGFCS
ncbi:glycosyltransferase family 4 protein [Methylosinus trichosporium]|uniref:glycosyltransferase family 4 protein n=2 Tax=Methylosinus TaxID=425 RepID=UPI0001D2F10A|nr:glycosyltransferase [Methylosinus trichosporium]